MKDDLAHRSEPTLMTRLSLKVEGRQSQAITPRFQQAVRLLQLSALDYEQELREMTLRNPFLELDDDSNDESSANDWLGGPMRDGARESHATALDLLPASTDVRQHMHAQAAHVRMSSRERSLASTIIESLDDDGYLRIELDEIGTFANLDPAPDHSELVAALLSVQLLGQAGCGARSLAECLLLQLDNVAPDFRALASVILTDHIDKLAKRDVEGIALRLECRPAVIDEVCAALRRLDPRPGWRFGPSDSQYVIPDVTARKVRGRWVAQSNSAITPRLRLNQGCANMFQQHKSASNPELSACLQEARWTLRNADQRFSTILSVAQAILRRQVLFLEYGPLAMKPLALRDIAEEIGMHESTVSRVTNNKFMATPNGLIELKKFFSRAMPMASGAACSATAIRGVVRELIESEDPGAPLSDVVLMQRLSTQGVVVARRTITKYRQALKIAPADRRRVGTPGRSNGGGAGAISSTAAL